MTDEVITGLGSAGQGFNRYRADELAWLIRMVDAFKKLPQGQREAISARALGCAEWLDVQPWARGRQMRHILLHLLFPESFERMASPNDKAAVVAAFKELPVATVKAWPLIDLDQSLLAIRQAEEASVGPEVDFYESPGLSDGGLSQAPGYFAGIHHAMPGASLHRIVKGFGGWRAYRALELYQ